MKSSPLHKWPNSHQNTSAFLLTFLTISLVLFTPTTSTSCSGPGWINIENQCHEPNYIEGCLQYDRNDQCFKCGYNYEKVNGICVFSESAGSTHHNNQCCSNFNQYDGQCQKCIEGLTLNQTTGECQDIHIPGCLIQNPTNGQCLNCAKQFQIYEGICIRRIPGCDKYIVSGDKYLCGECQPQYDLIHGQCSSNQWKSNSNQECHQPFEKSSQTSECIIPHCQHAYEWGCYKCQDGYSLTRNGKCIPTNHIPGCIDYQNEQQCKLCEDSLYVLKDHKCYPFGCLVLGSSEIECIQCDNNKGFQLTEKGQCVIEKCQIKGENGCQICDENHIWQQNSCVPKNHSSNVACVSCPNTHFINEQNQCQLKIEGCIEYQHNKCIQCEPQFYILNPATHQCLRKVPGCQYNAYAQCVSCEPNFSYNPQTNTCFIIGCEQYDQNSGLCSQCYRPFLLNKWGFCSIENCQSVNENGCEKCFDGYKPNENNSKCVKFDQYCIARNIYDSCIGCQEGYYLSAQSVCLKATLGCNYIDGLCTSCRSPFIYQPHTSTCHIDGCAEYFFGGCEKCQPSYQLRYNSCRLPNCLISENGKCLECNPDYIMRVATNQCINKDEYCYEYSTEGECIECAPKYFMSKLEKKCLARKPGCVYDDEDQCSQCFSPFKPIYGENKCYISGCLEHNLDNCKKCQYPFELTQQKTCQIANCLKSDDQKCLECYSNYVLEDGLCTTGDPLCLEYSPQSQCLRCKQGYRVLNNRCQYQDRYCSQFSYQGHCINCQNMYFLNPLKQCELKDNNCQQYNNGYCVKCKPYHYYFNSLCYQNSKGCALQSSIYECQKCEEGFELNSQGKCQKQITRLGWNSIDMDWGFGESDADKGDEKFASMRNTFTVGKENKDGLLPVLQSQYGELFYSSNKYGSSRVCIDADGEGWAPEDGKDYGEYVGAELATKETFYAVDIQCLSNNQMSSFSLEYSEGRSFRRISSFNLQCSEGQVKTFYFKAVEANSIRLKVRRGAPHIKIEFFFNDRLYVEKSTSSSSSSSSTSHPTIIQQTIRQSIEASHQLLSHYCSDDELCWFGLEICEPRNIHGFSLQQSPQSHGKIKSVYVDYSYDGIEFICWNECREIEVDQKDWKNTFEKPVLGAKMRVHVVDYEGAPECKITFDYE